MIGAICIASGPSLTEADLILCKNSGRKIFIVNDVYTVAPWADVLHAADVDWWDYHKGVPDFKGEKWCINKQCSERWNLNYIPGTSKKIFATEKPIAYGKHSGFQLLNLAYLKGERDVWLLGYDMGHKPDEPKHFHGEHPQKINRVSRYDEWIKHFKKAKPLMDQAGLTVVNMTRTTALDMFERGMLDVCL